jgi:hypothetical protein
MRPSYSWVIPISGFWPLVALGVTFLRFGEFPGDGEQVAAAVLGFLLVGMLSGLVLISLLRRTASRATSAFVVGGYVLAAPFGYIFGIVGPLSLEALSEGSLSRSIDYLLAIALTVGFYGSLPPVCGAVIGFLIYYILDLGS